MIHRTVSSAAIAASFVWLVLSPYAQAATLTVSNLADSGPGSLRDTIIAAASGDTIDFSVTGTITLTSGEILLNKNLAIVGPGARELTLSGNTASRIFNVAATRVVSVTGLTIADGRTPVFGGGVTNSGNLSLFGVTIRDNAESGLFNDANAVLSLTDCTVTGNFATVLNGSGGGIMNRGGTLTVVNSTISNNTSDTGYGGGGILNFSFPGPATATIVSSTIADNINTSNGGRGNALADAFSPPGSVTLKNTILASTASGDDCYPAGFVVTSLGHNLASDASCNLPAVGDLISTDPLLVPLQDNGGDTDTHALSLDPLSPAVDGVPSADCTDMMALPLIVDQRGSARPQDGDGDDDARCDIGAYEVPSLPANCPYVPLGSCFSAGSTSVAMKDSVDPTKRSLSWKWNKGVPGVAQGEFGDPVSGSSRLRLCVYDDVATQPTFAMAASIDPGGTCGGDPCWRALSDKGWAYKNSPGNGDSITRVSLKGGAPSKPKAQIKAKGANVPLPGAVSPTELFDQDPAVTIQLHTGGTVGCLTTTFDSSSTKKNSAEQFKAKTP